MAGSPPFYGKTEKNSKTFPSLFLIYVIAGSMQKHTAAH